MTEGKCFAYIKGKCKVLKVKKCEGCSFFKTEVQIEEEQKKVFKRIDSLNPDVKRNIMEHYYKGKMNLLDKLEVD